MAKWLIQNFGGSVPITDERLLGDNLSAEAWNVETQAGRVEGIASLELVHDMSSVPGTFKKAYRIPGPDPATDPDVWLPLPSPYSCVVPSPLTNDSWHRIYWTNPDGGGAHWTTYERAKNGDPPYALGFLPVEPYWVPVANAVGGTAPDVVPYVARSYLFTYVNIYGEESAPSVPSAVEEGASDAVWTVYGMSNIPPVDYENKGFPPVDRIRVYRTISGTAGGQFYKITDITIPPGVDPAVGWVDTYSDVAIVNNPVLESASWASPPPDLDGLIYLGSGMMIGFTGNTVHFSEPYRPHTWPAGYDQNTNYRIVALAAWQSTLTVLTQGIPSTGTGNSPANFLLKNVDIPEPCIARGSVISDILGVYYSSPNGLIMINYYGMQNQSQQLVTRNQWLTQFFGSQLIAARHRSQYVALNQTGQGFFIDYAEVQRRGLVNFNVFAQATSIWTDVYTGDALMLVDKKVMRWDSPNTVPLSYQWRSKRWLLPDPIELGACQVFLDPSVEDAPLTHNTDWGLPADKNALLRLYTNEDELIHEEMLTSRRSVFRFPSGLKSHEWQVEIASRVPIMRIEIASTMKELSGV